MSARTWRVILGLFIMFVIPVAVVSVVYLSPKTKLITLPIVSDEPLEIEFVTDSIDVQNDIKVYFRLNNCEQDIAKLQPLMLKTAEYPQPRPEYKEPHPRILYLGHCQHDSPFYYRVESITSQKEIILLDRLNRIRGGYSFADSSLTRLDIDIQHLMAETFNANKKAGRRMTF